MPSASAKPDWNALAPHYGRQVWLERNSLRTLLDLLDPGPGDLLLDVATGTAALPAELAVREGHPREVVGVDRSPEMLRRAPDLPPRWQLSQADATALPFADDSFDLVTASYLLHLLDRETRSRVIGECQRVLRPDGRIGVITIAPPRRRVTAALTAPVRRAAERYPARFVGLKPLDPGPDLVDGGFSDVVGRHSLRGYPALCVVARKPAGTAARAD
ncbi:MAG: methyltransferase domain-containing protein [Thermoleophilia bacterium]|nr:methyltransferase domain-containing protein [Thermoleophilia bacterium]